MKQIYFSDHNLDKSFKKKILTYSSYALAKGAPFISNKLAEKVLCTPIKSKTTKSIPDYLTTTELIHDGKKIVVYEGGDSSNVILFSHGWSGSAMNFSKFFSPFIESGFKVIAFDQFAHGNSDGDTSNYYSFLQNLKAVVKHLESRNLNIHGIVGHSMGTSATIGAKLDPNIKLCFIAPVLPVFESLYSNVKGFGLSGLMVKNFLLSYEDKFDINLSDIDPKEIISKMSNQLKIIHCEDDQHINVFDNEPYLNELQKKNVHIMEGLGHFRILKSKDVVNLSLEFMNE